MCRSGLLALIAAAALGSGCANVTLTPASIERPDDAELAAAVPLAERQATVARWREAVLIANDFLASTWRQTLPSGRFELDDAAGMTFVTKFGSWPIAVRCTTWGDLCVATGFAAQEREDGFVIGEQGRERDRCVDNSLFLDGEDSRNGAPEIAELILHETTHTVWREGTVGFWNGVAYYLEAVFLLQLKLEGFARCCGHWDSPIAGEREQPNATARCFSPLPTLTVAWGGEGGKT